MTYFATDYFQSRYFGGGYWGAIEQAESRVGPGTARRWWEDEPDKRWLVQQIEEALEEVAPVLPIEPSVPQVIAALDRTDTIQALRADYTLALIHEIVRGLLAERELHAENERRLVLLLL